MWRRRLRWALFLFLMVQVAALINGWWWLSAGAWLRSRLNRSIEHLPECVLPDGRLLVVAPHPDDEALAAGGLISERTRQGQSVFIVYVTMGDGFPLDTFLLTHTLPIRPAHNRALGYKRQKEALRASKLLGVPRAHLAFLGFPDRGLRTMLSTYMNQPFTSPYTGVYQNPYPTTWQMGSDYSGTELIQQMQEVIAWAAPDMILWPDGQDRHPDHQALHTLMSIVRPTLTGIQHWTYLVHGSLEWPLPKGNHPAWPMILPSFMQHEPDWGRLSLRPLTIAQKLSAIRTYKTQMRILSHFMSAFGKANELYRQSNRPL